jgi:hypothetical protein
MRPPTVGWSRHTANLGNQRLFGQGHRLTNISHTVSATSPSETALGLFGPVSSRSPVHGPVILR